jgi:hypothetical protein
MKSWLKTALCSCTMLCVTFVCTVCFAQNYIPNKAPNPQNSPSSQEPSSESWANSPQNWQNSPDNWQNNSQNWQNSSQNWQNSPQNWQNSGDNYYSTNGIYDSSGNRTGYSVPTENGGINYFNNDGSRRGYQPGH